MTVSEFWLGVLASLIATLLWNYAWVTLKWLLSVPFSIVYPNIIGQWVGTYEENGDVHQEHIQVTQQIYKYVSGKFISEDKGIIIEYKFKAEFTDKRTLIVRFWPTDQSIHDQGVTLFSLNNSATALKGGSVSYNFETGNVEARSYSMERKLAQ